MKALRSTGTLFLGGCFFYACFYLLFLYLPILFLPLFSFNSGTIIAFPLKGFTFKWYAQLAHADALIGALRNSIYVSTVVACASTALGLFAARALAFYRLFGLRTAEALIMTPLVVPGIIVGTSLLVFVVFLGLKPSLLAVIVGHTFIALPFAVAIMKSAFDQFDLTLEDAAYDLGESGVGVWLRVTLPILLPGIVASILVTFTVSFDEFILAFFLAGNEPTLPVYIWSQVRFPAKLPSTIALATIVILVSVLLLAIAEFLRRRGVRAGPAEPAAGQMAVSLGRVSVKKATRAARG